MFIFGAPPATRQTWLDRLSKRLVWYFPAAQLNDILSDFHEQFEEGAAHGKTESEIIQALGAPEEAAALLLEEEPAARFTRLRTSALWGAALALCFAFLWIYLSLSTQTSFWIGSCVFLAAFSAVMFMLIRGPARIAMEKPLPPSRTPSPALTFFTPAALMLAAFIEQVVVRLFSLYLSNLWQAGQTGAFEESARILRYGNVLFMMGVGFVLAVQAAWMLYRSIHTSIQYFPGLIHTVSAVGSIYFMLAVFTSLYIEDHNQGMVLNLLFRLIPYAAGLAISLLFQRWIDGRRPLPVFFQPSAITRQDWLHSLGVNLLGWFSTEQTLEILEDYQEQFELGAERGKSEEKLIAGLGRPETVVRDLLAEDRKARLLRRKRWPWVAAAVCAALLLLGEVSAFELGSIGPNWSLYYRPGPQKAAITALLLGTVSLFVLLRVRERAAVERRFPARRMPTIWVFLVPALACVLTAGFMICLIYAAYHTPDLMFWDIPAPYYLLVFIEVSNITLLFLLLWTLARSFSASIRYFPTAIHTAGSLATILCGGMFISAMNVEFLDVRTTVLAFLPALLPYLTGVLLALAVWLSIRHTPRKEG